MARNIVFKLKNDFTGGLNFRADQFQLAENESPFLINMEIDPRGGLFTRAGIHFKNTTPIAVSQATWNPKSTFFYDASTRYIMMSTGFLVTSGEVWYSTGANFTRLPLPAAALLNVSNPNGAAFTQWEQNLYIAAGSGNANIYKWIAPAANATTLTASGTGNWQPYATPTGGYAPRANIIKAHANKMFVANTVEGATSYPNRLRWSHEGLPEDWEENDYIDIAAGGEGIRALAIVDGQLLIFKPNAIFLLMGYDVDNFQLVEISTTTGVEYPQHVVEGDGGAYLFDFPKGLFFYNRSGLQDIFLRLSPLIVNNEINSGALDQLSLSYINGRLWMAAPYNPIPNGPLVSYPAVNFIFDQTIGQFGAYTMFQTSDGYGVVTGCDYRDSSDSAWHIMMRPDVKFAAYADDFDNLEDEQYDGAAITENLFQTTYATSWFYDDRYVQDKTFVGPNYVMKEVELDTTVGVQIYYDFDSSTAVRSQTIQLSATTTGAVYGPTALYDTAVYGFSDIGPSLVQGQRFGRCKAIQLEFTGPTVGSTSGRRWGVNSLAYKFKRRNIKG